MESQGNRCKNCDCIIPDCQVVCFSCEKKGYGRIENLKVNGVEIRGMVVQVRTNKI